MIKNEKVNLEQIYRSLMLIWFSLLVSQFFFLLILYLVDPALFRFDFSAPLLDENRIITGIFALAAVGNVVASFVLRKKYIAQAIAEKKVYFVQTAVVVGCALCEAVSVFGLMLAFVAGYRYFFLWFILGIAATLFHFPRRDDVIAAGYENAAGK